MLFKPFKSLVRRIKEIYTGYQCNKIADQFQTELKIRYPSYKSMDEFIDVERLKSLENIILKTIKEFIKNAPHESALTPYFRFDTGITLKPWQPRINKTYSIFLAKNIGNYNYLDIGNEKKWEFTPFAEKMPELMSFIKTLPFKSTGRIMLMFDTGEHPVIPHRDHIKPDICNEFIWLRTNFNKKFYVYHSGVKKYISGYSAWFDTVNQFHGAEPGKELNFSIRVDGIFNDEIRKLIPIPSINAASTPSLWATVEEESQRTQVFLDSP